MKNIWRVIRFIPEYRGRVAGVLLVGAVMGLLGTATPYLYKAIVDVISKLLSGAVTQAHATSAVLLLTGVFIALRIATVLFNALQDKQADDLWLETVSTFRQRVFDNMTRKSIDYFERTRAGEIMDRFGTITTITMWLSNLTEGTLGNILQMLFIVAVLLWKLPLVGVLMAGVLLFNFWISWRTMRSTQPYRRGWQAQAGRMAGLLAEMIGNIATVRSFGGESVVKRRYDDTQAEWKVTRGMLHTLEWRSALTLNVANTAAVTIAVILVVHGALQGRFTPGDILLVLTLSQNLINTIQPVARLFNQTGDIESAAERLAQLLDVESEVADAADAVDLDEIRSIEFENVSFAYPGKNAPVLHEISFRLDAGCNLALVGPSGSGKTTLVKLLMRFYDPTAGRILVNGRDLREYRQRSVRSRLGVVLQDVALFNDSIGENIAFARPGAGEQEVQAAAVAAHADAFIRTLPAQYATVVGERGIKLSGGEKQRIAIARAILKDPQLVILDEATSALDSESEQAVQRGLDCLLEGRSAVVIAHRLSTVMNADQILVIQHGRVVERGRHATLVAKSGGVYARLFALHSHGRLLEMRA
ncbi:ATP-binding cassette subfamily B protein [Panacagrimonas perspica]|uniref:ATP-binding cassette subfamily B protein n=1 Tax=Panacagrimonas perspica TaxID=381431 RepID=A0A4S3K4R8_9GAMM|nr:ABC transporter ATP-binding protein [Panacagrimonas perspica]TDU31703.1 ATP-binding cassette subfamily B protein [Panacagrimonas perspica]THD03083.1 unidentified transporter-ATP-binding protein [Panacagrimonas perspica]